MTVMTGYTVFSVKESSMDVHDEIRRIAVQRFVAPAQDSCQREFSIPIKALIEQAEAEGMSTAQRTPAFCTAIQTRKFLETNRLKVASVDGPASKKSTTVVVHYVFDELVAPSLNSPGRPHSTQDSLMELSGLLRGAIREGAAAFLRELRRDREPEDRDTENAA
jgi:hypothetical protein